MLFEDFFRKEKKKHFSEGTLAIEKAYSALIDPDTGVLLTVCPDPFVIEMLAEWTGKNHIATVNHPHYLFGKFFLATERPGEYLKWSWVGQQRKFVPTKEGIVTKQISTVSLLASEKRDVLRKMLVNMNVARYKIRGGVDFQEVVYMEKKHQALAFRDAEYDENRIIEFPYVSQYADYKGISSRQAADDILLKAKFDEEVLLKTEGLRLKYFNKVKEAIDTKGLTKIYEEFIRDCYVNARV